MKRYFLSIIALSLLKTSLLACCCEGTIVQKTTSIDLHLKEKNETNAEALNELLEEMKKLNNEILEDRISNLDDTSITNELDKFNIKAKNLYHANSLPNGVLYLAMKKNDFAKENIIESQSKQSDLISLNSKANLEILKNRVYYTNKEKETLIEKETMDFLDSSKSNK